MWNDFIKDALVRALSVKLLKNGDIAGYKGEALVTVSMLSVNQTAASQLLLASPKFHQ
jgi:hypothetical protein